MNPRRPPGKRRRPRAGTPRRGHCRRLCCTRRGHCGHGVAQRGPSGHRPLHPRDTDRAVVGHRRLLAGVRGAAVARRCPRRPLRASASTARGLEHLRRRVDRRDDGLVRRRADRAAWSHRPRSGSDHAGNAVHHHRHISPGPARQSGQHLGGCRRRGGRGGPTRLRCSARLLLLASGLRGEHRAGGCRVDRHVPGCAGVGRSIRASPGRRRRGPVDRRLGGPGVLDHRGADGRLAQRPAPCSASASGWRCSPPSWPSNSAGAPRCWIRASSGGDA